MRVLGAQAFEIFSAIESKLYEASVLTNVLSGTDHKQFCCKFISSIKIKSSSSKSNQIDAMRCDSVRTRELEDEQ